MKKLMTSLFHIFFCFPSKRYVIIIIKVINRVLSICCSSSSRMDCKHIYEKEPVIHYISTKKPHPRCPVAGKCPIYCSWSFVVDLFAHYSYILSGCPKILQVGRVVCDALLTIEIDEMHLALATNINSTMVEDFYRSWLKMATLLPATVSLI